MIFKRIELSDEEWLEKFKGVPASKIPDEYLGNYGETRYQLRIIRERAEAYERNRETYELEEAREFEERLRTYEEWRAEERSCKKGLGL